MMLEDAGVRFSEKTIEEEERGNAKRERVKNVTRHDQVRTRLMGGEFWQLAVSVKQLAVEAGATGT